MNRIIIFVLVIFSTCNAAHAEGLRMSVGVTRYVSQTLELAYALGKWDLAAGYVGSQTLDARLHTQTCKNPAEQPPCDEVILDGKLDLKPYYYASFQRIFKFRSGQAVRPFAGAGLAAHTQTNPLVSSPFGFSLSVGMSIGERFALQWRHFSNAGLEQPNLGQDILLASWQL